MPETNTVDTESATLTFLFTDVEGSTRLWEDEPNAMRVALQTHDEILRRNIEETGGVVFSTAGDAFAAAFESPEQAVHAATAAQQALDGHAWPEGAPIRVRMGVHTCSAHQRDDNFYGPTRNRAARLMSAAHGGQTVLSSATLPLVDDVPVRDLGEHRLKDLSEPERVWQLIVDGLHTDFPPLRTLDVAPTNLPTAASSFIGREPDIEEAMASLEANRLVTLTGVGGVGKTRLALQVAADASHHYPDGLWFLELAPVRVGDAVPYRFLETLGLATAVRSTLMAATLNQLLSHVRTETGDLRVPLPETVDNLQVVLDTQALGQATHLISGAALMMLTAGLEAEAVTLLGWLQTHEAMRNQLPDVAEEDKERAAPFIAAGAAMSTEEIVRFAIDTLQATADELG